MNDAMARDLDRAINEYESAKYILRRAERGKPFFRHQNHRTIDDVRDSLGRATEHLTDLLVEYGRPVVRLGNFYAASRLPDSVSFIEANLHTVENLTPGYTGLCPGDDY